MNTGPRAPAEKIDESRSPLDFVTGEPISPSMPARNGDPAALPASAHILVIEDSRTQAAKLEGIFEEQGWSVSLAASVEPAWDELRSRRPDLIVVDFHLPGMRGDEFCRRVRMNGHTRAIPILMLTVEDADASETLGLESGADDYLSKSVDPDILLLRVRSLLRKSGGRQSLPNSPPALLKNPRILMIDDSATYRAYLVDALGMDGFEVAEAAGASEGLSRLETEPFDCVLVDLVMPEIDGIEVCRRISQIRLAKGAGPMVLMLTSQENKHDMTRGLEAGADDVVGKSSDIEVLKARLRTLLRRIAFQEENQRILAEIKKRELETVRAVAAKDAAETRAALADQLEKTNRELRETQAYLIQSEKMASLGQLVAGIAHEVNNPLAFVINNAFTVDQQAEKILAESGDSLPEKAVQRLNKIRARLRDMRQGLDRVKDLVVNLRTFSRLDEGEFKTVDVHDSIDSVLMFLQHKTKGHIEVVKNYGAKNPLDCYAGQLNQVVMNLVSNAVDAIENRGTITIGTLEKSDMFEISVRDTGCGIPDTVRGKIFDPLFTTKPVGQGTGLGLAISYGIVRNHNGTIEVSSQEGLGSEFLVKIPLNLKGRNHGS
jgi:two-component system NtrC family sensor kinase